MSGYLGMSLFFTLSGFLITTQLHQRHNILVFFIRRLFRILPLACAAILFAAWLVDASASQVLTSLVFGQNYVHSCIIEGLEHFWSLCVEVHFYLFIGLLMWITRFRGFALVPMVWAVLFLVRFWQAPSGAIETHLRVDEILSGCLLALLYLGKFGDRPRAWVGGLPMSFLILLLIATCHPLTAPIHGLRGLAASALIGHTLLSPRPERYWWLAVRPFRYIAEISYALYVIHPLSMHGWLGQGSMPILRYAKRRTCFAITFGLAHLSTFYYEHRFIEWAKALCRRLERRPRPRVAVEAARLPYVPSPS